MNILHTGRAINVARLYVVDYGTSVSLTAILAAVPTAGPPCVIRAWAVSKPAAWTSKLKAKPRGREPGLRWDDARCPSTLGASSAHWLSIRTGKV